MIFVLVLVGLFFHDASGSCICQSFEQATNASFLSDMQSCGDAPVPWAGDWIMSLSSPGDDPFIESQANTGVTELFKPIFPGNMNGNFLKFWPKIINFPSAQITRRFWWFGGGQLSVRVLLGVPIDVEGAGTSEVGGIVTDEFLVEVRDLRSPAWTPSKQIMLYREVYNETFTIPTIFPASSEPRLFEIRLAAAVTVYDQYDESEWFGLGDLEIFVPPGTCPVSGASAIFDAAATTLTAAIPPAQCLDGLEGWFTFSPDEFPAPLLTQSDPGITSDLQGMASFDRTRTSTAQWPLRRRLAYASEERQGTGDRRGVTVSARVLVRSIESSAGERLLFSGYLPDELRATLNATNGMVKSSNSPTQYFTFYVGTGGSTQLDTFRYLTRFGSGTILQLTYLDYLKLTAMWVTMTFTWGPPNLSLFYINGVEVDRNVVNPPLRITDNPILTLGSQSLNETDQFSRHADALLDDVMFFSRTLSPSEVMDLHEGRCQGSALLSQPSCASLSSFFFAGGPDDGFGRSPKALLVDGSAWHLPTVTTLAPSTFSVVIQFEHETAPDDKGAPMALAVIQQEGGGGGFSVQLDLFSGDLSISLSSTLTSQLAANYPSAVGVFTPDIVQPGLAAGASHSVVVTGAADYFHLYVDGWRRASFRLPQLQINELRVILAASTTTYSVEHAWTSQTALLDDHIVLINHGLCESEFASPPAVAATSSPTVFGAGVVVPGQPTPIPDDAAGGLTLSGATAYSTGPGGLGFSGPSPPSSSVLPVIIGAVAACLVLLLLLLLLLFLISRRRRGRPLRPTGLIITKDSPIPASGQQGEHGGARSRSRSRSSSVGGGGRRSRRRSVHKPSVDPNYQAINLSSPYQGAPFSTSSIEGKSEGTYLNVVGHSAPPSSSNAYSHIPSNHYSTGTHYAQGDGERYVAVNKFVQAPADQPYQSFPNGSNQYSHQFEPPNYEE